MAFLYPFFLVALSGLAIPIILHFFGVSLYQKIYISNIALLQSIKIETKSIAKIKNLLLLLARLAVLSTLILAFAQPFFKKDEKTITRPLDGIMLIDNSISFNSNGGKEFLKKISEGGRQNANFQNIKRPIELETPQESGVSKFCTNCSTHLSDLLNYNYTNSKEVFVASDFQKSFVDLDKTAKNRSITLVHFTTDIGSSNISIDSVWVSDGYIKYNVPLNLFVSLKNHSGKENENLLVEVKLGKRSVASNVVSILPYASKRIQFPIVLKNAEDEMCEIRINDNSLAFDNRFNLALTRAPQLNVLLLNDQNYSPSAVAYSQEPIFKTSRVNNLEGDKSMFLKHTLIILENQKAITSSLLRELIHAARNGKSVVIFPSSDWGTKEYELLNNELGFKACTQLQERKNREVSVPNLDNPFFNNIFEKVPNQENMPSALALCDFQNYNEEFLHSTDGKPIFVNFNIGTGQIYMLGFELGEGETVSRNAIFLPLLYKIAERSSENRIKPYFHIPAKMIEFLRNPDTDGSNEVYTLSNGIISIIPEQKIDGNSVKLFLPQDGLDVGFWQIRDKGGKIVSQFGLNQNKAESSMVFYSLNELQTLMSKYPTIKVISSKDFESEILQSKKTLNSWEPWRYSVVISFLFLLLEFYISRYYKKVKSSYLGI